MAAKRKVKHRKCPKCGNETLRPNGMSDKTKDRKPKVQWTCRNWDKEAGSLVYCYSTVDPDAPYRGHLAEPKRKEDVRKPFRNPIKGKRIIFTAAQNATAVHEGFFNGSLQALARDIGAEIRVIPFRYHNPTSHWGAAAQANDAWADSLTPYLFETRKKLNENLVVMGDIKTQPTAVDPLTGMESLSMGESAIFGHPKRRMKTVATPQNKFPKVLITTGACTVENYIPATAGKKAEFHHVIGAVIVDVESTKKFHLHPVNAEKDGSFIFRNKVYCADGEEYDAPRYKALVMGDAHYRFADPDVVEATFGEGGLVEQLDPEILVWHDLLDAYAVTPHHVKNPFIKIAKQRAEFHIAEDEVRETVGWVCKLGKGRKNYIVPSNHDNMLERWIIREDWKEDPDNAQFYLETALQMAKSAHMSQTGAAYLDPFAHWVDQWSDKSVDITALPRNKSLTVGKVECGFHGDIGPSGARGSINNLSEIGVKVISGHGHSPAIQRGHWRTGTMTRLTAEYTNGPNNWLNAHVSIDAFGKRHMHICIDGKFYADNEE